jgi:hypothetical protein
MLSYFSLLAADYRERVWGKRDLPTVRGSYSFAVLDKRNRGLSREFSATVKGRRRWVFLVLKAAGPTIY